MHILQRNIQSLDFSRDDRIWIDALGKFFTDLVDSFSEADTLTSEALVEDVFET